MPMKEKIKRIKTFQKESNFFFYTKERLKCDLCGKFSKSVIEFLGIGYGCYISKGRNSECWIEMMETAFFENPRKQFLMTRIIQDDLFEKRKESKESERSKMTLKLRLLILERDNFCCLLCGRKPPEVKLEVDHIQRVADGGKSIEKNLRTLCFECNHGR